MSCCVIASVLCVILKGGQESDRRDEVVDAAGHGRQQDGSAR